MIKSDIATSRHCEVSTMQSRNLTCDVVTLQPLTRPFNLASSVATLQRLQSSPLRRILEKQAPNPPSYLRGGVAFRHRFSETANRNPGAEEA